MRPQNVFQSCELTVLMLHIGKDCCSSKQINFDDLAVQVFRCLQFPGLFRWPGGPTAARLSK